MTNAINPLPTNMAEKEEQQKAQSKKSKYDKETGVATVIVDHAEYKIVVDTEEDYKTMIRIINIAYKAGREYAVKQIKGYMDAAFYSMKLMNGRDEEHIKLQKEYAERVAQQKGKPIKKIRMAINPGERWEEE